MVTFSICMVPLVELTAGEGAWVVPAVLLVLGVTVVVGIIFVVD